MATIDSKQRLLYEAQWRELVLLNFEIDPKILQPYVPAGTELDYYNEVTYVSLVARVCRRLHAYGWPITLSSAFEEIQLRYYLKRIAGNEIRRGIGVVRHFVPGRLSAYLVGRLLKHPVSRIAIRHRSTGFEGADPSTLPDVEYRWKISSGWDHLRVRGRSRLRVDLRESKASFIFDRTFGFYSHAASTYEYRVTHAPWLVWDAASGAFECDIETLLGTEFVRPLRHRPASVYLARGSEIKIYRPEAIS